MGSGTRRSVPELVKALGSVSTSDSAMDELVERGSAVVPALATVVADAMVDPDTRQRAAVVLGLVAPAGAECLLAIVDTGSAEVGDLAGAENLVCAGHGRYDQRVEIDSAAPSSPRQRRGCSTVSVARG